MNSSRLFPVIILSVCLAPNAIAVPVVCEWSSGFSQVVEFIDSNYQGIRVRIKDKESRIRPDMVRSVRVLPSDAWTQAVALADEGRFDEAAALMKEDAEAIRPLIRLGDTNADRFIFTYAQTLRRGGRHAELADYLDGLPVQTPASHQAQAEMILAVSLASSKQPERAGAALSRARDHYGTTKPEAYYQLAQAYVAFANRDMPAAIDSVSAYLAAERPGNPEYAEALWLAAEAYQQWPRTPSHSDAPSTWNQPSQRRDAIHSLREELAMHYPNSYLLKATSLKGLKP